MDEIQKLSSSMSPNRSKDLLKRRSISLSTGVPFTQMEMERLNRVAPMKRQISTDDYGNFADELHNTSSCSNVSSIVLSKLRSFGRQIHRHMIETVNVTNDVSRRIPRSAVGDLYFQGGCSSEVACRKPTSKVYRTGKLSLDLEDTRRYMRIMEISNNLSDKEGSSSASKLMGSTASRNFQLETEATASKVSSERRLSTSAPQLEARERCQGVRQEKKKQSPGLIEEPKKRAMKAHRPREVNYDDQGQTWEIYGADQDPNALGQAIESHLEKMMQRKQREQRCFSLGNEVLRQNASSTKSSSRASHSGEQIFQAARRRFYRRAISSATPNSTQTANEGSPDRENRGRRSRLLNYINRILRRSSTSALAPRRRHLLHQDSIVECGEPTPGVEKVMLSTT